MPAHPINWNHNLNQGLVSWLPPTPYIFAPSTHETIPWNLAGKDAVNGHATSEVGAVNCEDFWFPPVPQSRLGAPYGFRINPVPQEDIWYSDLSWARWDGLLRNPFPVDLTVACWRKQDDYTRSLDGGICQGILFGTAASNQLTFQLSWNTSSGCAFAGYNGASSAGTGRYSPGDNEYHHYVGVWRDADVVELYIDGELQNRVSHAITLGWNTSDDRKWLTWGARHRPGQYPLYSSDGSWTDVRIYKRALTSQEVRQYYELVTSRGYDDLMFEPRPIFKVGTSTPVEGQITLTTSEVELAPSDVQTEGCSKFYVQTLAGEANNALVNIEGLHDSGEYVYISAGQEVVFHAEPRKIKSVKCKSDSGTVQINYGVTSRK